MVRMRFTIAILVSAAWVAPAVAAYLTSSPLADDPEVNSLNLWLSGYFR